MATGEQILRDDDNHEEFTEEDPLRQHGEKQSQISFREKVSNVFNNITIEPSLFILGLSAMIIVITSQNLILEKACRVNLNFTTAICDSLKMQNIETQNEYERDTQQLLVRALSWRFYLPAIILSVLALFAGSFSDKTGYRKIFIITAATGQMVISINNIINVYYFQQLRLEVLVFGEAIIESLSGGWCLCSLSAFTYISAITTDETRTYRLGLVNFCSALAFPMGMAVSGILLKTFGYYGCYGFTAFFNFINVCYLILVVKDPKRNAEQKKYGGRGVCYLIRQFFKLSNVKDTGSVLVKKTPKNRRVRLSFFFVVFSVIHGPMYGESSVLYMLTRYRFGWDEVKFSLFQTYNSITLFIGTISSLMIFSKYLQWHDSLLGILSSLSKIVASFVYCFAPNEQIFFIAPLVGILEGIAMLVFRSMITKLVESNELGKVNSYVGIIENTMPLFYVTLYARVYAATMDVLPGAVFLLGVCMTLPGLIILVWLFYEHRKQKNI